MLEDGPVVVPARADGERRAGVGLAALVAGDHLHLKKVMKVNLLCIRLPK